MSHLRFAVITTVLFLSPRSAGFAQPVPAGPTLLRSGFLGLGVEPGLCSKQTLLSRPETQKALELTDEQKAQLPKAFEQAERLITEQGGARQKLFRQFERQNDRAGIDAIMAEQRKNALALTNDTDKFFLKVLDARQRKRLEELQLRADGPMMFSRPEVQERLNLQPDQFELIGEILERGRQELINAAMVPEGVLPGRFPLRPEQRIQIAGSRRNLDAIQKGRQSVIATRNATMKAILKLLTKNQRARFDKLVGDPIDLPKTFAPEVLTPKPKDAAGESK